MPLVRLELKNEFGLGDPKLYQGSTVLKEGSKEILDGFAVAGLVGILRQLGDVAEFGAEIFHDLHEQVMATSERGYKMLSRIRNLEESLPFIEDAIHGEGSFIDLAYESGSDWRSNIKIMDSHLSCSNFPRFMMDSYDECRDPPCLYLLDKYDNAGTGACFKRYSDPSYFYRELVISETEKAQQIQKETKPQNTKRKYSRLRDGEIQCQKSTLQCKSLASIARFAPQGNDHQCFSAENSLISEMRLKPEVLSGPRPLKAVDKLNCTEQVSVACPSVIPNDFEYDKMSVPNLLNNQDLQDASQQPTNELVFSMDDSVHRSNSRSPSIIWDEKSELMKSAGLKFSSDTYQDLKLLLVKSESSKVEEPARNEPMEQAKPFPIVADLPRLSCDIKQFEEVTEADSFMDALNTLDLEAEIDFECQTKCIQSLSSKGHQKNESEVAKLPKNNTHSSMEAPPALQDSSNKNKLPSDTCLNVSRSLEFKQSTKEAGVSPGFPYDGVRLPINSVIDMSRTNALQEIDDDQLPWSSDAKLENTEAVSQVHISPPTSISNIYSPKLWTNGNILGLQPSKPPDICLPNGVGERTESNCSNTGMKSDKENIANGQRPQQLKTISKVEGLPKSFSLADQKFFNSDQFLSRNYVVEGNNSMKHSSTYIDCQYDDFSTKQNSQGQSETMSFSQHEGSQPGSHNVLTTHSSQEHKTTSFSSSIGTEPYSASNIVSQSIDSLHNRNCLSPSFSGLPQGNLLQGFKGKPSVTHTRSFITNDLNVNVSQAEGKPVVDIQPKRLNVVESQTFFDMNLALQSSQVQNLVVSQTSREQNLASQTLQDRNLTSQTSHEQNLINRTNNGSLEKSISSRSHYSQTSSPPLEHMKISFVPMNGQEASNMKLEVPVGCISGKKDGNEFSSFRLFTGFTLPAQDDGYESDDGSFCRSYPYSTEDLLSPRSDSNYDFWEQDDCSVSKIYELPDDLRRISSAAASISSYGGFEQRNHFGLKDICNENDTIPFQPGFIANIPSLESLINDKKYDSLLISPDNAATLTPTELPPPPPLPPMQWRLLRPSDGMSEDNYSNIALLVSHFEGPVNQNLFAPTKNENNSRWPPTLGEDGHYKKMKDKKKMDSDLLTNLSPNTYELHRREQLLHQIRDMDIEHKIIPCAKSKGQAANCDGTEEREDLLQQIKTKTFNLRRTATSRPFEAQHSTNNKVAAILEKANAIRQACASSDEADDSDEWNDG